MLPEKLTKREFFAALTLAGLIAGQDTRPETLEAIAIDAYALADEMIRIGAIKESKNPLSIPVHQTHLSTRIQLTFKNEGINTVSDILDYTSHDLMRFRNFGRKSLTEVVEYLDDYGLHLKRLA
jgi:DNA-directed RNA polymerase subunit alpha